MSSKPRKSASSNGNMKRPLNVKSCSISSMLDFLPISRQDKDTRQCVLDLTHQYMHLKTRWVEALDIIMGSLEDLQLVLVGTRRVEILQEDTITQVVDQGEEVMGVACIQLKDGGLHIVPVASQELVLEVLEVADMDLVVQITLMVVSMGLLVLGVVQT